MERKITPGRAAERYRAAYSAHRALATAVCEGTADAAALRASADAVRYWFAVWRVEAEERRAIRG